MPSARSFAIHKDDNLVFVFRILCPPLWSGQDHRFSIPSHHIAHSLYLSSTNLQSHCLYRNREPSRPSLIASTAETIVRPLAQPIGTNVHAATMSVSCYRCLLIGFEGIADKPQPDKRSSWLSESPSTKHHQELEIKCREGALSAADRLNQEIRSRKTPSAPSTPTGKS